MVGNGMTAMDGMGLQAAQGFVPQSAKGSEVSGCSKVSLPKLVGARAGLTTYMHDMRKP